MKSPPSKNTSARAGAGSVANSFVSARVAARLADLGDIDAVDDARRDARDRVTDARIGFDREGPCSALQCGKFF